MKVEPLRARNSESLSVEIHGESSSPQLAAWNAATYVAQIEDERLSQAMSRGNYMDATSKALQKYSGLWFVDESLVVAMAPDTT